MNVRDPFNLHRKNNNFHNGAFTAINLLRASATQATQAAAAHIREKAVEAVEVGTQALEKGRQAFAVEAEVAVKDETIEDMSFNIPKNVPSFTDPQRQLEDRLWPASGVTKHRTGLGGVQDRVGGFLNPDRSGLPMYKDKPYGYPNSGRARPVYRRKRVLLFLLLFVLGLLWYNGSLDDHQETAVNKLGQWGWLRGDTGKGKSKADWLKRRERVVEAMELSWDAYERYAWGKS